MGALGKVIASELARDEVVSWAWGMTGTYELGIRAWWNVIASVLA